MCFRIFLCLRIRLLGVRTVATGNKGAAHGTTLNPSTESTVAELREECKRRGLKNYSKLNKQELIRFLKGSSPVQSRIRSYK